MAGPQIVVVTPVRNEAAILDRFLAVTSRVADRIVLADQRSTDGSAEIALRYPKVTLVRNESRDYNEAVRQRLLLDSARTLCPGARIVLALDADEVIAADALSSAGWRAMLDAPPGTVLCFDKPDLYTGTAQCIRYDQPWPIGYVDDGAALTAKDIHSIRIPLPPGGPRLYVKGVTVLHYGLTCLEHQRAKNRLYCVIENVRRTSPVWRRRAVYAARFDWTTRGTLGPSRSEWFEGWERQGINMRSTARGASEWYDHEVLRHFARYGARRFWADDIWDQNWEACRSRAKGDRIDGIPDARIAPPPKLFDLAMKALDRALPVAAHVRRAIRT